MYVQSTVGGVWIPSVCKMANVSCVVNWTSHDRKFYDDNVSPRLCWSSSGCYYYCYFFFFFFFLDAQNNNTSEVVQAMQ